MCSSTEIFSNEVYKLRKMFSRNGYPIAFFNKVCQKFHERLLNRSPDESVDEDDEFKLLLVLPFIANVSKAFEKRLRSILSHKYNVNMNVVYKSCKLSSFFSLKDKTPLPLLSKVVYKFSCLRDANFTYIGETTRPLTIRVNEHLNKKRCTTAVGKHIRNCEECKKTL